MKIRQSCIYFAITFTQRVLPHPYKLYVSIFMQEFHIVYGNKFYIDNITWNRTVK